MKTQKKTPSGGRAPQRHVRIEFRHETAQEVFIVGTFNDWQQHATRMITLGDGKWVKELSLPPGRYEYRFVVDGQWVNDPKAEQAPNAHGSFNSVLTVEKTE